MPVHENTNTQRHQPPGRRPTGEAQRFGLGAFSEHSVFPQFVKLNRAAGSLAVSRPPKAAGFSAECCVCEIVAACGRGRRQGEASVPLHEPEWDKFHDHTRQSMLSGVVIPDRSPRSIWSWRTQLWIAAALTPQLDGRGRDRLTSPDERSCSHSELVRERSWHE